MAFNNLGAVTYLGPGQSAYWWYDRGGGDFGTQLATADVKIPSAGPRHNASDEGKAKFNSGYTQYYVTITNVGTAGCWHNLQGGGVV
jgi:hypothetical protein